SNVLGDGCFTNACSTNENHIWFFRGNEDAHGLLDDGFSVQDRLAVFVFFVQVYQILVDAVVRLSNGERRHVTRPRIRLCEIRETHKGKSSFLSHPHGCGEVKTGAFSELPDRYAV